MQGQRFFDDMTKMANGFFGGMFDTRKEVEQFFQSQMEAFFQQCNVVSQQQFDMVSSMAEQLLQEQQRMQQQITDLQAQMMGSMGEGETKPKSKPARKRNNAKKSNKVKEAASVPTEKSIMKEEIPSVAPINTAPSVVSPISSAQSPSTSAANPMVNWEESSTETPASANTSVLQSDLDNLKA